MNGTLKRFTLPLLIMTQALWSAKPLSDDLKLNLGVYLVANHSSNLSISSHNGYSITIDLQKILKMET